MKAASEAAATVRGRGRPRRALLDEDRIVDTALEIVDTRGFEALTMDNVATALGVRAASLYNHIPSKAALIEGVRDRIVAEMDTSMFDRERWDVALEQFAHSYRAAFIRHPMTVATMAMTPISAPGTFAMYEAVARGLVDGGWPPERVVSIIVGLEYVILGSVFDFSASGQMLDPGIAEEFDAPVFARCIGSLRDQRQGADDFFDQSLARFMRGVRQDHPGAAARAARRRAAAARR